MTRIDRLLAVLAPFAAALAVAAGLRWGAPQGVAAAIVYGAPAAASATAAAWQVFAFRDDGGSRWPMAAAPLSIVTRHGESFAQWRGDTNADGVAEARLPILGAPIRLDVSAGATLLARGDAAVPTVASAVRAAPAPSYPAWAPFARRNGRLAIDVAVLGQRVAPGFPATICAQVTDAATHAPMAGVEVRADDDPGLTPGLGGVTDSAGWARITVIPVGLAISLSLRALRPERSESRMTDAERTGVGTWTGEWVGGLYASPGAAKLETRARWSPAEEPEIDLVAPSARQLAYVEVDDDRGRAWATSVPLVPDAGHALPSARIRVPRLPPGLYWAVAAGDPRGASELGPGTSVRPFFVASSDDAALGLGTDRSTCMTRAQSPENAGALWPCLCVAAARPVARWVALDGVPMQLASAGARHARGVVIALGAVGLAALLEVVLLLRAALPAHAAFADPFETTRGPARTVLARSWTVVIAILVALLGFALLAAFIQRST